MSEKVQCGDNPDCLRCVFYEKVKELGISPEFTKNQIGRCDWYSNVEKHDKPHQVTKPS